MQSSLLLVSLQPVPALQDQKAAGFRTHWRQPCPRLRGVSEKAGLPAMLVRHAAGERRARHRSCR